MLVHYTGRFVSIMFITMVMMPITGLSNVTDMYKTENQCEPVDEKKVFNELGPNAVMVNDHLPSANINFRRSLYMTD